MPGRWRQQHINPRIHACSTRREISKYIMAAGRAEGPSRETARRLYSEEKYSDAIREYGRLIDAASLDDPEIHIYYSNRSAAYMQIGDVVNALDDAEQCKRIKPTWAKGYSRCGSALMAQGKFTEAVYALQRAQELEPSNTHASMLQRARQRAGMSDNDSGTSWAGGNAPAGVDFGSIFNNAMNQGRIVFSNILSMAATMPSEYRMAAGGIICLVLYQIYKWLFKSSYDRYDDYGYDDYSYGRSSYGLSWSTYLMILGAAWKLPPMFPHQLGAYAQPFFGLSFMTFMYLVNMLTQGQRFGGGGLGGMMGGGRRRRY